MDEKIWLWIDEHSWIPRQFERYALRIGIQLVGDELESSAQLPLLVRVTNVEYRPSDYQEEGLVLAIAKLLSECFARCDSEYADETSFYY